MAVQIEIDKSVFLPAYHHLLDTDCDINFLWGGRDSGKSYFIASKLLMDCLSKDYFRCILIKKTHESIKDSQWQMLKDVSESWNVSHLFDFNSNPLEIRCINGNKFISRGCDKAGKLKSITNPSHAWYEEGNQLTEDDFTTVSTTLRSEVRVQQWFSFNPEAEGDLDNYWLYKNYFKDVKYNCVEYRSTIYEINGEKVELKYSSTHTDYTVNRYIRPERVAKLMELQSLNPYWYAVYCKGHWGKKENKRPWFQNFSVDRHVKDTAVFNPALPVYFSIDFNVDPFICLCAHVWTDVSGMHLHVFDEIVIEKNGSVPEMCDRIQNQFGVKVMATCYFTGDATQRKREIVQRNNINAWDMINKRFNLGSRLLVPRANPSVEDNRHLISSILAFHPDLQINSKCKRLIYDMQFVEADEQGGIIKKDRNNEAQRCDAGDEFRYLCNVKLRDFFDKYRFDKK